VAEAAAAGGACRLLDYAAIERTIGVRFDVAAAMRKGRTRSCVVQAMGAGRPDLALSMTPTSIDAKLFAGTVVPAKATKVPDLGKAAYRAAVKPGRGHGPGIEVGWLSRDKHLIIMRYTLATNAPAGAADELAPKLVELAKQVEARPR
jgi:hypothetical protein